MGSPKPPEFQKSFIFTFLVVNTAGCNLKSVFGKHRRQAYFLLF